jgi:hypothetical protein
MFAWSVSVSGQAHFIAFRLGENLVISESSPNLSRSEDLKWRRLDSIQHRFNTGLGGLILDAMTE